MLPVRSKSLFELASVPPVHSESLFEPAVQDHYSKVLVSVALCSETLYSALLCYVHGYARSRAERSTATQSTVQPTPALLNSDLEQQARTDSLNALLALKQARTGF